MAENTVERTVTTHVVGVGDDAIDYLDQPAPDPAMFRMSSVDDGTRTNPPVTDFPSHHAGFTDQPG